MFAAVQTDRVLYSNSESQNIELSQRIATMKTLRILLVFAIAFAMAPVSAHSQEAAAIAVAAPAAPATLWSFLGIPQGVKKVQGALTNRRGNLPRLEPKDAIKALNDPRNLFSDNKAIKKAAELKIQEDLKPQKIKALKYLTSIGCGCYDKGGEVTAALIAAAEDCTEDVRLTVMQEIKAAAANKCCNNCGQVCCCSEKMLKKLAEVAYERDDEGCYKEPSARVRQAAAEALRTCVPNSEPPCIAPEEPKVEEPKKDDSKKDEPKRLEEPKKPLKEAPAVPEKKPLRESKSSDAQDDLNDDKPARDAEDQKPYEQLKEKVQAKLSDSASMDTSIDAQRSSRRRFQSEYTNVAPQFPSQASGDVPEQASGFELEHAFHPEMTHALGTLADNEGVVISYDTVSHTAHVHFSNRQIDLREGDEIAFASDASAQGLISGKWKIVFASSGCVRMTPLDEVAGSGFMAGQHVVLSMQPAVDTVKPVSTRKRDMSN